MTITQIECFIEAAKTGSFGKAGAKLYISQQTISRQIKALEDELGFPLFDRSRTGVQLTESGKLVFDKWKQLLIESRSVIDKARDVYLGGAKKVLIGMVECGNMKDEIAKGLMRFNEKYPDLEVEYSVLPMRELFEELDAGKLHIVLCLANEAKNRPDLKSVSVKNHYEETGFIFANSHPLAKRKKIELHHMAKETIGVISRSVTEDHLLSVQSIFRKNGITEEIQYKEYSSPYSLQMALVTGKCVTIMFEYIIDGAEDKLQFRPIEIDWAEHGMTIVYKDEKYATKAKNIAEEFE